MTRSTVPSEVTLNAIGVGEQNMRTENAVSSNLSKIAPRNRLKFNLLLQISMIWFATVSIAAAGDARNCIGVYWQGNQMILNNRCPSTIIISWKTDFGGCASGCSTGKFEPRATSNTSTTSNDGRVRLDACFFSTYVGRYCSLRP